MTVLASAFLGAGVASAAPTLTCPTGQKPVAGTLGLVCKTVTGTTGGVVSAVPKATAPVRSVVPKVVRPPRSVVPEVVDKATRAVVPAPASRGAAAGSSSSGGTTKAPASASAAPASSAPAAAVPAPAVAAATSPLAADTSMVTAFGAAPAGLLTATGLAPSTGSFAALMSAVPGGRGYDPGLLLSSVTPVRQFLPSPVTTSSTAQPLALLGADDRVGTPILLAVLTATVLLALGVRGGVLRRARTRTAR